MSREGTVAPAFDPNGTTHLRGRSVEFLFQPVVELGSPTIVCGYEALARIDGASPVVQLMESWVAGSGAADETALLELLPRFTAPLPRGLRLSLNVSAAAVVTDPIAVATAVAMLGPERPVCIEILEWGRHPDLPRALAMLADRLVQLGGPAWRLALDDVSPSLVDACLIRELRPHIVKTDLAEDPVAIEWVVRAAASVGADVVLEHVETVLQARAARAAGVRYGQGYLFGRPMTAERVADGAGHLDRPVSAEYTIRRSCEPRSAMRPEPTSALPA